MNIWSKKENRGKKTHLKKLMHELASHMYKLSPISVLWIQKELQNPWVSQPHWIETFE